MAGSLAYAIGIYYVTNNMHCNLIGRTLRSAAVRLLCSLFARFLVAKGAGPQTSLLLSS